MKGLSKPKTSNWTIKTCCMPIVMDANLRCRGTENRFALEGVRSVLKNHITPSGTFHWAALQNAKDPE